MAFGDVVENPDKASRALLLLDVQSDLLGVLETRVVVPLYRAAETDKPSRLTPIFDIEGAVYRMITPQLAAVPRRHIGRKIGTLADQRSDIIAALDMLFTGL
jgi:toxin CcdB